MIHHFCNLRPGSSLLANKSTGTMTIKKKWNTSQLNPLTSSEIVFTAYPARPAGQDKDSRFSKPVIEIIFWIHHLQITVLIDVTTPTPPHTPPDCVHHWTVTQTDWFAPIMNLLYALQIMNFKQNYKLFCLKLISIHQTPMHQHLKLGKFESSASTFN